MFSHKLKVKRQYISAYKDSQLATEVIQLLKDPKRPTLREISIQSGIPYHIIQNWNAQLKENPSYFPGKSIGQHLKYFSNDEEQNISDMIKAQFIKHGIIMSRQNLRDLLMGIWQGIHPDKQLQHSKKDTFSYQFIKQFCKRNRLSFRKMRKKKRSDISQLEVDNYIQELIDIFANYENSQIYNMDETSWNFVYLRGDVLSIKGQEVVDATLPDDYKKSFSIIATIGSDGSKYPPVLLAK